MRHKDILLNKSDQMFGKDLLNNEGKTQLMYLFAFKIAPFDRTDEL